MNSRTEIKFLINRRDFFFLRSALSSFLTSDVHSGSEGYDVRSLYLDTHDMSSYHEKLDGLLQKEKWRYRIYNGKPETLKLERKTKNGNRSSKSSYPLTFYHGRWPKLLVDYRRIAFVEEGLRVTLDFQLNFSRVSQGKMVFGPIIGGISDDICVLEIKSIGSRENDVLSKLINSMGLAQSTFSKYAHGIQLIYGI